MNKKDKNLEVCVFNSVLDKEKIQEAFDKIILSEEDTDFYLLEELLFLGAKLKLSPIKSNINKNFVNNNIKNSIFLANEKLFNFFIKNEFISEKDKATLDCFLLVSLINDFIFSTYDKNYELTSSYISSEKKNNPNYDIFFEINNILYRKNIFKRQNTRFVTLFVMFCYYEIFDNLSSKIKMICYKEFKQLSSLSKKALTSLIIKAKNEEVLFNLLNYDLSLKSEVIVNNRENIFLFEMMSFNNWAEMILRNKNFDIRLSNKKGENILFFFPSHLLQNEQIENLLRLRINELNNLEKSFFFQQFNQDGLNPLMNAILFQDELLIDFIQSFNVKPWDCIEEAPIYKSPLEFLNNYVLNVEATGNLGIILDSFKTSFWSLLSKKWNTEYCYLSLSNQINNGENKNKNKKIKI